MANPSVRPASPQPDASSATAGDMDARSGAGDPDCPAGQRKCDGVCATPVGGCCTSADCPGGLACVNNECSRMQCAQEGRIYCGGACVACSHPRGTSGCRDGRCELLACESGYRICGGVCIADDEPCGTACGGGRRLCSGKCVAASCCSNSDCGNGFACVMNQCSVSQCADSRQILCGGICTSCESSRDGQAVCRDGRCELVCNSGFRNCNGKCMNELCATPCWAATACSDGVPPCRKGVWVCDAAGLPSCRDSGIDSSAEGTAERCTSGNVCRAGVCRPPCRSDCRGFPEGRADCYFQPTTAPRPTGAPPEINGIVSCKRDANGCLFETYDDCPAERPWCTYINGQRPPSCTVCMPPHYCGP